MANRKRDTLEGLEDVFDGCFRDFEKSDYDLSRIAGYEKKVVEKIQEIADETGVTQPLVYPVRLFMEYLVRRVPREDRVLQELLMERVRDMWKQRHLRMEKENTRDLLRQFDRNLNRSVDRLLRGVSRLLERDEEPRFTDDQQPIEPLLLQGVVEDEAHPEVGVVIDGVFHCKLTFDPLALVLNDIASRLPIESSSSYALVHYVEKSGKVDIGTRKFSSLLKSLEKIRRDDEFVPDFEQREATGELLLRLLLP